MTTGLHVVAALIVMTAVLVVMMTGHLVVRVVMMIGLHVVAALIVMTAVLVVMMTGRVVAAVLIVRIAVHVEMMIAQVVVHVVMMTGLHVAAVLIVTIAVHVVMTTDRVVKIHVRLRNVVPTKSACERVAVVQRARCLGRQSALARSGLMKGQHVHFVAPVAFVQRQQGVHKRVVAKKCAHWTVWWKSLNAQLDRAHQFAH
jgi:hypothetical protein